MKIDHEFHSIYGGIASDCTVTFPAGVAYSDSAMTTPATTFTTGPDGKVDAYTKNSVVTATLTIGSETYVYQLDVVAEIPATKTVISTTPPAAGTAENIMTVILAE